MHVRNERYAGKEVFFPGERITPTPFELASFPNKFSFIEPAPELENVSNLAQNEFNGEVGELTGGEGENANISDSGVTGGVSEGEDAVETENGGEQVAVEGALNVEGEATTAENTETPTSAEPVDDAPGYEAPVTETAESEAPVAESAENADKSVDNGGSVDFTALVAAKAAAKEIADNATGEYSEDVVAKAKGFLRRYPEKQSSVNALTAEIDAFLDEVAGV
jgi:hypothetical protein